MQGRIRKLLGFLFYLFKINNFIINRKCDALFNIYSSAAAGASAASTGAAGSAAAGAATRTGARP
jgi:hypothetical protein